jgi:hypothetical protein
MYKIVESLPGEGRGYWFLVGETCSSERLASPLHAAALAVSGGAAKLPRLQLRLLLSEAAHSHIMFVANNALGGERNMAQARPCPQVSAVVLL